MWKIHRSICLPLALFLLALSTAAALAGPEAMATTPGPTKAISGFAVPPRGPIPAAATKPRGHSADGGISAEAPGFLLDPYQVGYVLVVNPLKEAFEIRIDDRDYGTVQAGEYATYLVQPGANRLLARSERQQLITDSLQSKPGQPVYYYLEKNSPSGGAKKK